MCPFVLMLKQLWIVSVLNSQINCSPPSKVLRLKNRMWVDVEWTLKTVASSAQEQWSDSSKLCVWGAGSPHPFGSVWPTSDPSLQAQRWPQSIHHRHLLWTAAKKKNQPQPIRDQPWQQTGLRKAIRVLEADLKYHSIQMSLISVSER